MILCLDPPHFIIIHFYGVAGQWRKVRCSEELKNRAVFEMFTGGYLCAEVNFSIHVI